MTCSNPQTIWPYQGKKYAELPENNKSVQVPCGKCLPCLMNKRADWAFRLEQEHKVSKSAHFVTLTYDEKHMPSDGSLRTIDLQNYMKRLRKNSGKDVKIRYYAVGEYGAKSGRPHYHILLFNADEFNIRKAWRDIKKRPIGIVHVGRVTPASVAYCTKYIVQPELNMTGKKKSFATMSKAYGIGAHYLTDEMVAWHRIDDRNYAIRDRQKVRLPRFYREKIWYRPQDRERISSASMKLTLSKQEKERNYYKQEFKENWERAWSDSRNAVLQRVKIKVAFTQTY